MWRPLMAQWVAEEGASRKPDFYSLLSGVLVAREQAWLAAEGMLGDYVRPRELWAGNERLYLLYVDFYDILDPGLSVFRRLPDGTAIALQKWALRKGCEFDRPLFRVPGLPAPVFCTEEFVRFVEARPDGGLAFRAVKPAT